MHKFNQTYVLFNSISITNKTEQKPHKSSLSIQFFSVSGNFGTIFVDQSYWQSSVAAKPKQGVVGFLVGGLCWFAIPFGLATTTSLAYIALSANQNQALLSETDVDAGKVLYFRRNNFSLIETEWTFPFKKDRPYLCRNQVLCDSRRTSIWNQFHWLLQIGHDPTEFTISFLLLVRSGGNRWPCCSDGKVSI